MLHGSLVHDGLPGMGCCTEPGHFDSIVTIVAEETAIYRYFTGASLFS